MGLEDSLGELCIYAKIGTGHLTSLEQEIQFLFLPVFSSENLSGQRVWALRGSKLRVWVWTPRVESGHEEGWTEAVCHSALVVCW